MNDDDLIARDVFELEKIARGLLAKYHGDAKSRRLVEQEAHEIISASAALVDLVSHFVLKEVA